jgi:hypothetical protein
MRARAVVLTGPLLVAASLAVTSPVVASAGGPVVTRGGGTETFPDELFLDLCGIETDTTVIERWVLKEFPDGAETLQVERTFDPADPRLPVEKGAGTSFTAPDGSRWVVGKPIQIIGANGGLRVLDAGRVLFDPDGDVADVRGPHPSLDADLADVYCP